MTLLNSLHIYRSITNSCEPLKVLKKMVLGHGIGGGGGQKIQRAKNPKKLNIFRPSKILIVSVGPLLDLDRKAQIYAAPIIALTTRNGRNSGSE